MRRVSVFTRRGETNDVTMTPLIDVVFQLLVFFLWTASFQVVEHALPGSISTLGGTAPADTRTPPPPEEDFDEVIVRVSYTGGRVAWTVNDSPLGTLNEVRGRLRSIGQINREVPVIVHPDPDTPLGAAINVYDLARVEGFVDVAMAVDEAAADE
jgi:biopolymer transport protein ExbD